MTARRKRERPAEIADQQNVIQMAPLAVRKPTAGRLLDISPSTVRRLIVEGRLRTIRVNADERVLVESIREYVAAQAEQT